MPRVQVAPEAQRLSFSSSSGGFEATRESSKEELPNPLPVLTLNRELALDGPVRRAIYRTVEVVSRVFPFACIYGGTLALLCCTYAAHDWAVLLSLSIYTLLYAKVWLWNGLVCGSLGLLHVWVAGRVNWHTLYRQKLASAGHGQASQVEEGAPLLAANAPPRAPRNGGKKEIEWDDVFHVVMIPNYMTPMNVLVASIQQLRNFSLAKSNMGICLAFEEREEGVADKALELRTRFGSQFRFVKATFHPPNLPHHVPGKSSNECWAFAELARDLTCRYGFDVSDPRVVITVIDDDISIHPQYFEAVNYHFLRMDESRRYLTIWQSPVCQFKGYTAQPSPVRVASVFASLHELSCLANCLDCHVPCSSYSLSLILASAVGGWDPVTASEDRHMLAKCRLMTEGRARCEPIYLPLLNSRPEESLWDTVRSRWTQATRHAFGAGEVVYVVTQTYVGMCESGSPLRAALFFWRMMPLIGKLIEVHFCVATMPIWPFIAFLVIGRQVEAFQQACEATQGLVGPACGQFAKDVDQRLFLHSWMVFVYRRALTLVYLSIMAHVLIGALYFTLVNPRAASRPLPVYYSNPFLHCVLMGLETVVFGPVACLLLGALPVWIACVRIMCILRFAHTGRADAGGSLSDGSNL